MASKPVAWGHFNYERQRGMYAHPTYAVSTSREPLGVLDAWMWARQVRQEDGTLPGVCESLRWTEGYERLAEMAPQLPQTRLVYLADREADREADIMALMVRARDLGNPVDWLVRSKNNRSVGDGDKLWAQTCAGESLGELRFTLPSRPNRKAREVVQQVWAQTVTLQAGARQGQVQATCIVAREVAPPAGEKAIEWRLLTNLPITDWEQAARLIDWYRGRWEIEMFFHVLKNGCRIEALQLGSIERIERAIVLYMGWLAHCAADALGAYLPGLGCAAHV